MPLITGESFAASAGQDLNVSISMNYVRPGLGTGQHYIHSTFYAGVKIGRGVFIKYGFAAIFRADIVQAIKIKFLF